MKYRSIRKPNWLISHQLGASKTAEISRWMKEYNLHTVCESAKCPNRGECFEKGTAVFLILGDRCTRNCRFCAIKTGKNLPEPDPDEPKRVAEMAKRLGLKHVIITSVTRDDLLDGGAEHFANTIKEIRNILGDDIFIEVLTPDFLGQKSSLDIIINEKPTVFNHNLETVKKLHPNIRPQASYDRSLSILLYVKQKNPEIITKTGIMLGLGEKTEEVLDLILDVKNNFVDIITIGQYLKSDKNNCSVKEYIHPTTFNLFKKVCEQMGFLYVESGPLVRSSYYSKSLDKIIKKNNYQYR
ncbi:MAG: lipoyl synthase [Candidatus Cloacimonetes bacterium]|nr:lipoyl synthase [Candidatus Cloacimonadota bacterium]MBL7085985.1 lipoyl synthase [Candidatus Cloacimonadota bacterium]